ncbi:acetyltransferase [Nocardiopsis sp. CA-288880]|uniref:acetyltransferase n=1 Tax=Nocardiopsis sp. CA-288880 TaxID=3239995 RepID=UPI003D542005
MPSSLTVLVRPSTGADEHPALAGIWRSAVVATHAFLTREDVDHYEARILDSYLPRHDVHVAVDPGDRPLGFIGLDGHHIDMLFVHDDARGRGVGRALLAWAAERHPVLTLDVNEQNPSARGFYAAQGFEETGRSPVDGQGRPFPLVHMRRAAA